MGAAIRTPLDLVARHEGFRAKPYCDRCGKEIFRMVYGWRCACASTDGGPGNMTIGYGLNLDAGGLCEDEARPILRHRLNSIAADRRIVDMTGRLDYARAAVVYDLAFNLGIDGLLKFKHFLGYLAEPHFGKAAEALENSLAAKQEPKRIKELARMIFTGAWPEGDY